MGNTNGTYSRLSWLGKERDRESGLGDHGVRKYDNEAGRFLSVDPLWEKYYAWTPYHYCGNDPVNKVDVDGKDMIVLLDRDGAGSAGHAAVLIGNDKDGWSLYSKNGGESSNVGGESVDPQYGLNNNKQNAFYPTLQDFKDQMPFDKRQARYDKAYYLKSDKDDAAKKAAKAAVKRPYNVLTDNCVDAVSEALQAAGYDPGNTINVRKDKDGNEFKTSSGLDPRPNVRVDNIQKNNKSTNCTDQVIW